MTDAATDIATDTAFVRDVLEQIYTAWSEGDADGFAALYREDATVVMPGVVHRGRSTIRDYMAAGFAGPLKGSRGIDRPLDVRLITPDTAVVVSTAGILLAGEEIVPAERERVATWVLSRTDGRWLIAAYTNTPAHLRQP